MDAIVFAPVLVIAEGYATAASLSEALGQATVSAFDSGNLPVVARALHEKFPHKPIVIASDDDHHLEVTLGINSGRIKALEAAQAVNGKAIFPIFAPGEKAENPKEFTDFNDLATKSKLGPAGVARQVLSAISQIWQASEKRQENVQNLRQEYEHQPRQRRAMKVG
jgi:putative DNA primase/helicase